MPLFLCELFFGESLTTTKVSNWSYYNDKNDSYQGSSVRIALRAFGAAFLTSCLLELAAEHGRISMRRVGFNDCEFVGHMTNISGQMLGDISRKLHGALSAVSKNVCFQPLGKAIFDAIEDAGIPLDRLQIPMMRQLGFRHPLFGVIVITVYRGEAPRIRYVPHDHFDKQVQWIEESTPFRGVLKVPGRVERFDLEKSRSELRCSRNCSSMAWRIMQSPPQLANGSIQPFSMTARPENPFPDDLEERLQILNPNWPFLSLRPTNYVSRTVAETYLGKGTQVGAHWRHPTGSYSHYGRNRFCDIRGFTRMSEGSAHWRR